MSNPKFDSRNTDRQLVPVYVECKGCGKLATVRAQVNYSAGWNGSMGSMKFELLEQPRGLSCWSSHADGC